MAPQAEDIVFSNGHATKYHNFAIGCYIFIALGIVLSLFLPFYVRAKTRDPSQKKTTGCLTFGLVWLAILYMFVSWSTFYQAQLYPYKTITPAKETGGSSE